ncbi:MAG: ectoine hydroxylase-related dioxygenase (phytanoyl-CoA dioxygenase family) [Candidatus Azotimanducaceae bacterium]|jgi:ectoine hydroxylase-related dioxygenase (phytanoyl-CoA dioxygenase family)
MNKESLQPNVDDSLAESIRTFHKYGFAVLKGVHQQALCDQVCEDYNRYCSENSIYVAENLDTVGHEKRLVNFHHYSDAALQVGTNTQLMRFLDTVFQDEAYVYTSLTFKYGTQQPVHRDSPHFATWPEGGFVGAWTALEDVHPDAGPLFYFPESHRLSINPNEIFSKFSNVQSPECFLASLDEYNGEVIRASERMPEKVTVLLEKGDSIVWHPQLMHGGMPANNIELTRMSIVFHCAAKSVQVHQHEAFFTESVSGPPPVDRYGSHEAQGRQVALAGDVAFMD